METRELKKHLLSCAKELLQVNHITHEMYQALEAGIEREDDYVYKKIPMLLREYADSPTLPQLM